MPRTQQLELFALIAIARLGDDAYGVTIHEEIERVTARHVSMAGVYNALDRLERQELVRTFYSEPRAERGGRARRHFAPTAAGRAIVARERALALRLWQNLAPTPSGRKR